MSFDDKMRDAVQAYFDLFNAGQGAAIAALFADDAQVIDPVGTAPKSGKAEILAFYEMATGSRTTLEKTGPTRIVDHSAAFAFKAHIPGISADDKAVDVDLPSGSMVIDIIDVFDFNEDGKIKQMRAYWGPSNISQ